MKSIIYIANIRLPTEKAHGLQVANTCYELSKQCKERGIGFKLYKNNQIVQTENIFEFYNLKPNPDFNIVEVPVLNLAYPQYLYFWIQYFQFFKRVLIDFKSTKEIDSFYTRDVPLAVMLKISGFKNVFFEAHGDDTRFISRILYKYISGIVCITQSLKDLYKKYISEDKILISHDGVNLDNFSLNLSRDEAKEKLGLDKSLSYVVYTGSIGMYDWKGVDVFLEAGRLNTDPGVRFLVVGGSDEEVGKLRRNFPTIDFVGRKKPGEVPFWQKAAHVLVIPNKKGYEVSEKYTSPLKLFEYMASGSPILASDLPSLREVVTENSATFFEANNSKKLLEGVVKIIKDWCNSIEKAEAAKKSVIEYSYENRAKSIVDFVLKNI